MRILILGAGATGGAFGTLLTEGGRDVTYLVREKRAEILRREGLRFVSPSGDRTHPVTTLVAGEPAEPFDLIIIAVKATHLDSALRDVEAYIGPESIVLPILNGMTHVDTIEALHPEQVLGGLVKIVATLDGDVVRQMTDLTTLTIGRPHGEVPTAIVEAVRVPGIDVTVTDGILSALWAKWAFIAAAGVVTCLFRGPVGAILQAGGEQHIREAIAETERVAASAGHPVPDAAHAQSIELLCASGSGFTSSLYRDLIAGHQTEAEHILGELARIARALDVPTPLLDLALVQIRTTELAR